MYTDTQGSTTETRAVSIHLVFQSIKQMNKQAFEFIQFTLYLIHIINLVAQLEHLHLKKMIHCGHTILT